MKQILKEGELCKVTREDDRVIKEYATTVDHINKKWLLHYQAFFDLYGGVVKVHEADCHRIVMDYVEGESLMSILYNPAHQQRHQKFSYKCFSAMLQSLANMADFSSTLNTVWFHSDAGVHNFMYAKKRFTLIDPDSFFLTDNPYPGTFVSSLHPLHSILQANHMLHKIKYEENSNK